MSGKRKTVDTTWQVVTYDVWGNSRDGYYVNDAFSLGEISIRCKLQIFNKGTEREFVSCGPSDYQIKKVFGINCRIDTDGDDMVIYVNRSRDSYPIGELRCISHKSLSPIQSL